MGTEEGVIPMGVLAAEYFTKIIKNTMLNGLCTLSNIDIEKIQVSKNSGYIKYISVMCPMRRQLHPLTTKGINNEEVTSAIILMTLDF